MKIYQLLAICVFHSSVFGISAFTVKSPRTREVNRRFPSRIRNEGNSRKTDWLEATDRSTPGRSRTGASISPKREYRRRGGRFASSSMERTRSAFERAANINDAREIEYNYAPVLVQGSSLRTWSFRDPDVERVQVVLNSEGRPMDADIELWQGPDNTPCKVRVYSEDGERRPFSAVLATPRGPNTISVRNIGQMEFPLGAHVTATVDGSGRLEIPETYYYQPQRIIQGGALKTYAFQPAVDSVQVLLETDGRPLNARIELLQGPNNNKQVVEIYSEDGLDRPFYIVIETPGSGNVVRVVNTSTMEFPLNALVEPYSYGNYDDYEPMLGGDDEDRIRYQDRIRYRNRV